MDSEQRTARADDIVVVADPSPDRAVAGMTLPNDASVGLHLALGFEPVGTYRRIGWKHHSWHDLAWAQRAIAPGEDRPVELR